MNRLASGPLQGLPWPKRHDPRGRTAVPDRGFRTSARTDARGISVADAMPAIARAVSHLDQGEVLEVLSSDPGSVLVLLAWADVSGNALLDVRLDDDYRFEIQRGGKPAGAPQALSAAPHGARR